MSLILVLQSPIFPPIALGLLGIVLFLLRPRPPGRVVEVDEEARLSDDEVKRLIDRAIEAKRRGDLLCAGWHYEQGKLWVKAAECYEAAGDGIWAAELYRRGGDCRRAGELYRLNGYALEAATTLEKGGFLGDAGVNYAVAGDLPRAARLFETAGRMEEAAELYLRLGMYHQAGKLFENAGDRKRAADAYEQMMEALGRRTLEADLQIARILEKEGRYTATIRFLEAVGEVMASLRTAIRRGEDDEALRIYREYRDILAGPLLRGAKEGKLSATVLVDLFERAGDHVPAARMARLLGQWRRVAELYEPAGDDEKAAVAWEEASEPREAALAHERAGEFQRAAALFEEGGEPVRAIHCYRQADCHFAAGQLYEQGGEFENAVSSYQKVEEDDPSWRDARLQLAALFVSQERSELALDTYIDVLSRQAPGRDDLDAIVQLAGLLTDNGRFGEAAACWSSVARLDASREGIYAKHLKAREMAKEMGQPIPQTYPYVKPAPRRAPPVVPPPANRTSESPPTPGATSSHAGSSSDPSGEQPELPVGVTAHPIPLRHEEEQGSFDLDDDDGWKDSGSDLVPKDTMVSFEAYIDGFSDPSLVGDRTADDIEEAVADAATPPAASGPPEPPAAGSEEEALPGPDEVDSWELPDLPAMEDELLGQDDPSGPARWEDEPWSTSAEDEPGSEPQPETRPEMSPPAGGRPEFGADDESRISWSDEYPARPDTEDMPDWGDPATGDLSVGTDDPLVSGVLVASEYGAEDSPVGSPLESFDVFGIFDKSERFLVEQFLEYRGVQAGETILQGDDEADGLLLLLDGEVEVHLDDGPPARISGLRLIGADLLLRGELPDVFIVATTHVQCWVLSRGAARRLAEKDREIALRLARALRSI